MGMLATKSEIERLDITKEARLSDEDLIRYEKAVRSDGPPRIKGINPHVRLSRAIELICEFREKYGLMAVFDVEVGGDGVFRYVC